MHIETNANPEIDMRSKEIVLAVLVKGHRTDLVQVWAYRALTTLKTMLRSNETWSRYGGM